MTTIQESKLNMCLAVRNFTILNESVAKAIPNYFACYTTLEGTIKEIQSIGELQKEVKTGFAKDKKRLKETLITIAADNSRKLAAVAKFTKNETLMDKVRFSISELNRMTDVALKDYAEIIYDKVNSNIEKLAEYEVTQDTQKVFMDTITAYDASLSTPRSGIAEKRKATAKLTVLFDSADAALEGMDIAAGTIQLKNPDFINGYKTVRKLIETSAGNIALKGSAKDTESGEPVKGVLFIFRHTSGMDSSFKSGNGEISKKTAEKGHFNIKSMPSGTYQVLVSKPGYKDKTVTVSVADGEISKLVVELEKA
jgi:hypothetical protein